MDESALTPGADHDMFRLYNLDELLAAGVDADGPGVQRRRLHARGDRARRVPAHPTRDRVPARQRDLGQVTTRDRRAEEEARSVRCPECQREFQPGRGLSCHRNIAHGVARVLKPKVSAADVPCPLGCERMFTRAWLGHHLDVCDGVSRAQRAAAARGCATADRGAACGAGEGSDRGPACAGLRVHGRARPARPAADVGTPAASASPTSRCSSATPSVDRWRREVRRAELRQEDPRRLHDARGRADALPNALRPVRARDDADGRRDGAHAASATAAVRRRRARRVDRRRARGGRRAYADRPARSGRRTSARPASGADAATEAG